MQPGGGADGREEGGELLGVRLEDGAGKGQARVLWKGGRGGGRAPDGR